MPRFSLAEDTPEPRRAALFSGTTTPSTSGSLGFSASSSPRTPWTSPPASNKMRTNNPMTTAASQTPSLFNSRSPTTSNTGTTNSSFTSPAPTSNSASGAQPIRSVRLACRSPDGKAWYSLTGNVGNYSIALEIGGQESPAAFKTRLPQEVQDWLRVDAPCGLLCLEGDGFDSLNESGTVRLCLYASKAIYICNATRSSIECHSLLAEQLLDYATRVVSVRPPPQVSAGFSVYSPANCCTVLLQEGTVGYQLICVQVQDKGKVSQRTVLAWHMEHVEGSSPDEIVDFCFMKSDGPLRLLSSMTIALLRKSGEVDAASPVVFDGTTVAATAHQQAIDALRDRLASLDRGTQAPHRRQVLAAQRYLVEVFASEASKAGSNHFFQAKFSLTEASDWPVRRQPAVLHATNLTPTAPANCIESIPAGEAFGGLLIGHRTPTVIDIALALTNPAVLLPLFSLGGNGDCRAIADDVWKCVRVVDYVHFDLSSMGSGGGGTGSDTPMDILLDPRSSNLLHVIISTAVYTISTNSLYVAVQQLRATATADNYADVPAKRTTAWPSTQVDQDGHLLCGAVVWQERILSVRLNNGLTEDVHIGQAQCRHELESLFPANVPQSPSRSSALTQLEQTPAFVETLQPLLDKLNAGIASMTKLVGSTTSVTEMTSSQFAVAVDIKKRMEEQVFWPMRELKEKTKLRKAALLEMIEQQQNHLNDLFQVKEQLELGRETSRLQLETIESNIRSLTDRSQRCLNTIRSVGPVLSKAEMEFCDFMEKSRVKVEYSERKVIALKEKVDATCEALDRLSMENPIADESKHHQIENEFTPEQLKQIKLMNNNLGGKLERLRRRLAESDKKLQVLAKTAGVA